MLLKIFVVYWLIGIFIVLLNITTDIKKGFKSDVLAYLVAALAVSLLYPIAIIRAIKERRKKEK